MTSDALVRIEHKLDLIISALQQKGVMMPTQHLPKLRDSAGDVCPACGGDVQFGFDLRDGSVLRSCGCIAPLRSLPLPTTSEVNRARPGIQEDQVPPDDAPKAARRR